MQPNILLALSCAIVVVVPVIFAWADPTPAYEQTSFLPGDHPAIGYNQAPLDDAVSRLEKQMAAGKVTWDLKKDGSGYLLSLLKNLDVNPDSQIMVFSKTSFQAARIEPKNPRALYFNDKVTIGFVRGSDLLEVATQDPKQGAAFYTFDQTVNPPEFVRRDVCLQCHYSDTSTSGIPGLMIASVYPDAWGMPAFRGAQALTDHRTPFSDRWGGWYVTGTNGDQRHRGNAVGHDSKHPDVLDTANTQNLTDLKRRFDPAGYLAAQSDIVALLTIEHQLHLMNLMTRVGWETRMADYDKKQDDPKAQAQFDAGIEELVRYMLFVDEPILREPVKGLSTFTQTFPQRGPRDAQGRSLRDFDLQTRLFKYPLSYLLYSEQFDALPGRVRDRIYQRIYDVLSGKDQSKGYAKLTAQDRTNVLEIVRDTKKNLPAYWSN